MVEKKTQDEAPVFLADSILKAAGSGLMYYEKRNQEKIIKVAREILDAAFIASDLESGRDDLLAALEYAVAEYGKPGGPWNVPGDPGGWLERARAAIEKAKGEPTND